MYVKYFLCFSCLILLSIRKLIRKIQFLIARLSIFMRIFPLSNQIKYRISFVRMQNIKKFSPSKKI